MDEGVTVNIVTQPELICRKAELERILAVLTEHTLDEVCAELGQINYLLGELPALRHPREGQQWWEDRGMNEQQRVEQLAQQMLDMAERVERTELPAGASTTCPCGRLATCVVEYVLDGVVVFWRVSCNEHKDTPPQVSVRS